MGCRRRTRDAEEVSCETEMESDGAWVLETPVPVPAGPLVSASYVQTNTKRSVLVPLPSLDQYCCLLTCLFARRTLSNSIYLCSVLRQAEHFK